MHSSITEYTITLYMLTFLQLKKNPSNMLFNELKRLGFYSADEQNG